MSHDVSFHSTLTLKQGGRVLPVLWFELAVAVVQTGIEIQVARDVWRRDVGQLRWASST